jgi:hypothetical protein
MRAMADSLGHEDVFEELQTDNYWWVLGILLSAL